MDPEPVKELEPGLIVLDAMARPKTYQDFRAKVLDLSTTEEVSSLDVAISSKKLGEISDTDTASTKLGRH